MWRAALIWGMFTTLPQLNAPIFLLLSSPTPNHAASAPVATAQPMPSRSQGLAGALSSAMGLRELVQQVQAHIQACRIDQARQVLAEAAPRFPRAVALQDLAVLLHPAWQALQVGHRVQLRVPTQADAPFVARCFQDDAFMALFHPTAPRQRSAEAIGRALAAASTGMPRFKAQHWVVERITPSASAGSLPAVQATTEPIGLISVVDLVLTHRRAEMLIGMPHTAHRGVGLATEAALLALDVCFNQVGLNKLTTLVLANNPHSQRSTLALGFEQEGLRKAHFREPGTGEFIDCFENGLTQADFWQNTRLARLSQRLLGRDVATLTAAVA